MSIGHGSVSRGVIDFIVGACAISYREEFVTTTEQICRAVYRRAEVTKDQRSSVLRAIRRLPSWRVPQTGGWTMVRQHNRRGWLFIAPPSNYSPADPERVETKSSGGKIASAIRMLTAETPGERDAAVLAVSRLLAAKGMSWNDVALMTDGWG